MPNPKTREISRRHVLRGAGVTLALPFLEVMAPFESALGAGSTGANGQPLRFAGLFMPNGVNHSQFTPKGKSLSTLPPSLRSLAGLEQYVNVVTGMLLADSGHAAGTSSFLTGQVLKRTPKASEVNVKNPSIDQIIGNAFRKTTTVPTLELATHRPKSGVSMSGHSKIYLSNISWRNPTTPVSPEINPKRAFDRLFKGVSISKGGSGLGKKTQQKLPTPDASVLDLVLDQAKDLKKQLGKSDQHKLDEYFTAVREVEERITNQSAPLQHAGVTPKMMSAIRETGKKMGKLDTKGDLVLRKMPYQQHIRLQLDVMALALWSNSTRSSTFMFGDGLNGSANMSFLEGVQGNHHTISHHGNKAAGLKAFALVNSYFIGEYAYFLKRLKNMDEGGSNVLENSLVMLGTNLSSGQGHGKKNVPAIVTGHAGGRVRGNRHIKAEGKPMANLLRSVVDKMGVDAKIPGPGGSSKIGL